MKKLPKELTTVTRLSKILALIMFIMFPVFGFLLGAYTQRVADLNNQPPMIINYIISPAPSPTLSPMQTQSTTCNTDADCPMNSRCVSSGPIIHNPQTGQNMSNKTCVQNGTVVPL